MSTSNKEYPHSEKQRSAPAIEANPSVGSRITASCKYACNWTVYFFLFLLLTYFFWTVSLFWYEVIKNAIRRSMVWYVGKMVGSFSVYGVGIPQSWVEGGVNAYIHMTGMDEALADEMYPQLGGSLIDGVRNGAWSGALGMLGYVAPGRLLGF